MQIKIDKDELLPNLQAKRHHAHCASVEKFHAVYIGRPDQPAIERIGPAVITAAEHVFAAAPLRDRPSAMPAYIAERAKRTFFVANHDNRLTGDLPSEKCFRIGNAALAAVHLSAWLR